ncbi:MAG: peptide methionine sulfoxide reductase [Proteobacteria bacterium]|nr:peptide methionine sulfoxide reductase [Pseudomonadota bacterium]
MHESSFLTKTRLRAVLAAVGFAAMMSAWAAQSTSPMPTTGPSSTATSGLQTAVFAGGCFWGVDAVFKHVKGVAEVESGYAGGNASTAQYEKVSEGNTGHAEAVRVKFNPAQISYPQLLQVFFRVAHDPTELNRQGPDVGSQYRSAIFFTDAEQQKTAQSMIQQLTTARAYSTPIVTQLTPLKAFYPAEAYHQNYLALHPDQPYIVYNDLPKLAQLQKQFPDLYQTPAKP